MVPGCWQDKLLQVHAIAEMKALEKTQPDSYKFMKDGGFVVRHTQERKFNCVATDQALEQTINKEGKSQGGKSKEEERLLR